MCIEEQREVWEREKNPQNQTENNNQRTYKHWWPYIKCSKWKFSNEISLKPLSTFGPASNDLLDNLIARVVLSSLLVLSWLYLRYATGA